MKLDGFGFAAYRCLQFGAADKMRLLAIQTMECYGIVWNRMESIQIDSNKLKTKMRKNDS